MLYRPSCPAPLLAASDNAEWLHRNGVEQWQLGAAGVAAAPIYVQLSARAQGFGGSRPPQTLWALPAPSVGRARRPHRPASHGRDGTVPQQHVHRRPRSTCIYLPAPRDLGVYARRKPSGLCPHQRWGALGDRFGRLATGEMARFPSGTCTQSATPPWRPRAEAEIRQKLLLVIRRSSTSVSTDEPAARCAPTASRQGPASCRLRQRRVHPGRRSAPALAA